MPTIEIEVKNKIAKSPAEHIICGNSDYKIKFAFDEEWAEHNVKTARFVYNRAFEDVVFHGDVCNVPIISNTTVCLIGVFAGDLRTTTPALVNCDKSILCTGGIPADPEPNVYAQLMAMIDAGMLKGDTGKSAYQYAQDGGYEGTEEEFAELMASYSNPAGGAVTDEQIAAAVEEYMAENPVEVDIPETLPNPNKLTFTGAVQAEYDGSKPVEVEIPEGGGGIEVTGAEVGQTIVVKAVDENGKPTEWEAAELPSELPLINKVILAEEVSNLSISTDTEGNAFDVTEFELRAYIPNTASAITVEAYMKIPTWANLLTPTFKTDGHNIIIAKTMGTPYWVELKSHSYRSPQFDSGWNDGRQYVEIERHVSAFGIANWSGVLPVGTVLEVYGK